MERIRGLSSRSRTVAEDLLSQAGIKDSIRSAQILGIGSSGLNVRGNRDEDGTHTRLILKDGRTFVYREYSTTSQTSDISLQKEMLVMAAMRAAKLPAPSILSSAQTRQASPVIPAAMLLSDPGGSPLEVVFTETPPKKRGRLWAEVGEQLLRLHSMDATRFEFLNHSIYQRPWTQTIAYFMKSLNKLKKARPDLASPIGELMALRRSLQDYFDAKRRTVCFNGGYYLPGMMMLPDGADWSCINWLSLGYYVSVNDFDRDVVSIALQHREWTGADLPDAFYKAYGSKPDEIAQLIYTAALQLPRGVAYTNPNRGLMRKGPGPPPYSTAVDSFQQLPETVERLQWLSEALHPADGYAPHVDLATPNVETQLPGPTCTGHRSPPGA